MAAARRHFPRRRRAHRLLLPAGRAARRPARRVVAVEPVASSAALLRRNVALNRFENVEAIEAAAADRDGRATLRICAGSAMWASLRSGTFDNEVASMPVATRSLDSILAERGWPAVAGIKIDVEGAESDVLRGSDGALRRNPGAFLLFEASGGGPGWIAATLETLDLLEGRGYRFRRLTGRCLAPPVGALDLRPLIPSPNWYDNVFNVVAERPLSALVHRRIRDCPALFRANGARSANCRRTRRPLPVSVILRP